MAQYTDLDTIVKFCKRKGFIFPSSEIYGGYQAVYDFGPLGKLLKDNLVQAWKDWMITYRNDVVEIEGAIFLHPKVWEASGHTSGFADMMVEDLVTKKRYRADHLVEEAEAFQILNDNHEKRVEQKLIEIEQNAISKNLGLIVDCLIVNSKGQYLAQKRSSTRRLYPNCWDLVGGHVDLGDTLINTIYKEVKEETGWTVSSIKDVFGVVGWVLDENVRKDGDNPNKQIIQVLIEVESTENLQSEEGKVTGYDWFDKGNLEILRNNGEDEFYIYDAIKSALETYTFGNKITKKIADAGSLTGEELDDIISSNKLLSPDKNPLSKAKKFNLLVKTHLGPVEDDSSLAYLKGESCQNIYVDWKQVQETTRRKLPFGITQLGKAFRNEITVKQFIFRTREFEQIDLQYFVKPGTEDHWYEYWKNQRYDFYTKYLGYNPENLKWHQHSQEELVFYCKEAWDIYYRFGKVGFKEMEGLHNRTDYDTRQHMQFSGTDLQYFDPETNQKYLPYVIEASLGVQRMFLSSLFEFYKEEEFDSTDGKYDSRVVLKLPMKLAPYKMAILPLMKKDGLGDKAHEIFMSLRKQGIMVDYDEAGSIGKRYRRQDENGTPYCVTVDYDTLKDDTVTIRDRDTMEQKRIKIEELVNLIK